jgi:hypothetical protein
MSMWTAIALIVIASVAAQAWRYHVKARGSDANKEELEQLGKRMDDLEKDLRNRVETLERIVTDSKDDLKRQFDRLDKAG